MLDEIETDKLIADCATDKNALEALYREYKKHIFALSMSMCGDYFIAEECVQETFIRLPKASKKFKSKKLAGKAFLLQIGRNVTLEILRREKRHNRKIAAVEDILVDKTEISDGLAVVSCYISKIPEKYRLVFTLKVFNDLTFKQIAKITGTTENTAKTRYYRACERLKEVKFDD